MYKIYIYSWQLLKPDKTFKVHAYGLYKKSSGCIEPITVIIKGYQPYCYFDAAEMGNNEIDRIYGICGVYPSSIKNMRLTPTTDISLVRSYVRLSFKSYTGMIDFAKCSKKSYMADVDPITSFLSNNRFMFTGWYRVQGNIHQDIIKTDVSNISYISGDTSVICPKVACIDIETFSSDGYSMPKPYKRADSIQMISVIFKEYLVNGDDPYKKYLLYLGDENISLSGVTCISCLTETDLIEMMADVILKENPQVITGYNIFGFDLGYIIARLKLRLLPLPNMSYKGITTTHKVNWSSSAYGQNTYDRVEISGRVFVDLMLFFRRMKLDKYSLDYVSKKFIGEGKKDMSPDLMWKYFRSRDIDGLRDVAEYCIQDSVLTLKLFDMFYIWTDVCEMSSAMRCSIEDIYTRGEQIKVLNQVIYKCVERNLVLVQRPKGENRKYEGAYVLDPQKGVYDGCTVMDFQSLYPSILIAYNLCPSTYIGGGYVIKTNSHVGISSIGQHKFLKYPVGVLPDLVKNLLQQRASVKNQLRNEKDPLTRIVLDRRQNALKICANSVYGITGFTGNKYMGHVQTAESVAYMGRKLLDSVVNKIRSNFPVQVVYGDTDSCMIYHNGCTNRETNVAMAQKIVDFINRGLDEPIKLLVEKYYTKMAFLTKKRYLMYDGKDVTSKGVASARRNYCTFARQLYTDTVRLIFENPDNVLDFVVGRIQDLLKDKVPLSDLVMTKSIKSLESYTNTNVPHVYMATRLMDDGNEVELGSRLEYVFVKMDKAKLQGQRMFTPREVQELNLEVDYLYYIDKQLVIPIDELLDLVGNGGILREIHDALKYI